MDTLTLNLQQTISLGRLVATPLPLCPTISLFLLAPDYPRGRLPHDEMLSIMDSPAYWSFCWASGQVLARHLIAHPEFCQGKRVLDLGAGSGVVAIAAAMTGATQAIACDNDPHALDASRINAELNGVNLDLLDDLERLQGRVDLIIAADVLYDRDNLGWLARLPDYAAEILIADSRIRDPQVFQDYDSIATVIATTIPDLDELKEYGEVKIYHRTAQTTT
jgi:predicted nicotinamide N-methyase